jgi:tRNA threonylcarbamoyladenosine biosynthesis protein TsaB
MTQDELRAALESDPKDTLLVGDSAAVDDHTLRGLHRVKKGGPRHPQAEALIEATAASFEADEIPHPDDVRPMYLREPDVQINWAALESNPWGDR